MSSNPFEAVREVIEGMVRKGREDHTHPPRVFTLQLPRTKGSPDSPPPLSDKK